MFKELELKEFNKRNSEICLIASENYPSQDILNASGSIFQCKYAEGFPNKRYYQGCEVVDEMEELCINKCLELFNAKSEYNANVQPNSGASANMIVYNAILQPGDRVLAMDTSAGGHISHGHPLSFLAKYFNVKTYGVDEDGYLDYNKIEKIAKEFKPKLIICGASNYSRIIDFERFAEIRDKVKTVNYIDTTSEYGQECYLMADIAHISLLVAKGLHPTPVGFADFITSTTHKQLAGPRGAFIIYKKEFDKEIKRSTIPSLFGGPLEHQIFAKLVCFEENLTDKATENAYNIVKYAKIFEEEFKNKGVKLLANGTDNHLMTIDLTDYPYSGKEVAEMLESAGVIVNCNAIPNDKRSFLETSGIRLGVPAIVTRGFNEEDCRLLAISIASFIESLKTDKSEHVLAFLKHTVRELTKKYSLTKIYNRYDK